MGMGIRLFADRDERTTIEVLHMFTEMYDELGNDNIDLTHNLEVMKGSIKGKINIHQSNFNLYGYTVNCHRNDELSKRSNLKKESYLFSSSSYIEDLIENIKRGGVSEDTATRKQVDKHEKKNEFADLPYEKELVLKSLRRWQERLIKEGYLLERVMRGALTGNKSSQQHLQTLGKRYPELKECIVDAKDVWEYQELLEKLKMKFR